MLLTCTDSLPLLQKAFRRCEIASMELIPVQNAQFWALTEHLVTLLKKKYELQQVFLHQKVFHLCRYLSSQNNFLLFTTFCLNEIIRSSKRTTTTKVTVNESQLRNSTFHSRKNLFANGFVFYWNQKKQSPIVIPAEEISLTNHLPSRQILWCPGTAS